jgi:hypothetical protein
MIVNPLFAYLINRVSYKGVPRSSNNKINYSKKKLLSSPLLSYQAPLTTLKRSGLVTVHRRFRAMRARSDAHNFLPSYATGI